MLIRVLKDQVINQIAAGEVIEDAASVVKELIENALDAKATEIRIETKGAGRGLIKVADNGCGMNKEDLVLCLERHATSKITDFDDLFSLRTLGFRGEALPSIASCSKMKIVSSYQNEAHELYQEGGSILKMQPASRGAGTTVEVQSLFCNVPVRKKFAKSAASETRAIHHVITCQALAHPSCSFSWFHEEKQQLSVLASEVMGEKHIKELLGEEYFKDLISLFYEEGDFKVEGFVGTPSAHLARRGGQYLFLNKRPVTSPFISNVIAQSYGTSLPEDRHPIFILSFKMPPSLVDVNVHPQKKEIRFCDPEKIRTLLFKLMQKRVKAPFILSHEEEKETLKWIHPSFQLADRSYTPIFKEEISAPSLAITFKPKVLALIGHYFLVQMDDNACDASQFAIVDAKKGAKKIVMEEMQACTQKGAPAASQTLLIPAIVTCKKENASLLNQALFLLHTLGIGIKPFGGSSFMIDALPPDMEISDLEKFAKEISEDLSEVKEKAEKEREEKIIARLSSYRTLGPLTKEKGEFIMEKLLKCENPFISQEGECIVKILTEKELEIWMRKGA